MIIDWTIGAIQQLHTQHGQSVWNWSGVSEAEGAAVGGPYQVAAGQIFTAGPVAGEVFAPGAAAGQVFVAGANAGQVE